jgi:hypothetical protein
MSRLTEAQLNLIREMQMAISEMTSLLNLLTNQNCEAYYTGMAGGLICRCVLPYGHSGYHEDKDGKNFSIHLDMKIN